VPSTVDSLEKLLAAGKESALLRFSLGNEHLKQSDAAAAIPHLRRAVELDPTYSAAWKLLGRALAQTGALEDALRAFRQGLTVAEARGDKQAAKEMAVFARRIEAQLENG
jgi:Flp pilus assembly protein TadD